MKTTFILVIIFVSSIGFSQNTYDYAPSKKYPFGRPHPDAPQQIKDYAPMIGTTKCQSFSKNPDGTWAEPVDMLWTFKYIMNGMGVQDETLKSDGTHSGSIRQYSADSSRWYVHYYTNRRVSTVLSVWEGNLEDGKIILYKDQPAPNGTEGYFRLTFSDITDDSYKWIGEWVDKSETVVFPTWRIECAGKL